MIKNSLKQTGSAHVVIVIVLVIALIGALGFVFWQNFVAKNDTVEPVTQTSAPKEEPKEIVYKTYQDDAHNISFKYPETWNLGEPTTSGQTYKSVSVKTDSNDNISLETGIQGLGGTCGGTLPVYTVLDVIPTSLKSTLPTSLSVTAVPKDDGTYDVRYGLTDRYDELGDVKACANTFYYVFSPGWKENSLMGFGGTKHVTSLDDAKKFVSSDEYGAIKKMILTLSYSGKE